MQINSLVPVLDSKSQPCEKLSSELDRKLIVHVDPSWSLTTCVELQRLLLAPIKSHLSIFAITHTTALH